MMWLKLLCFSIVLKEKGGKRLRIGVTVLEESFSVMNVWFYGYIPIKEISDLKTNDLPPQIIVLFLVL